MPILLSAARVAVAICLTARVCSMIWPREPGETGEEAVSPTTDDLGRLRRENEELCRVNRELRRALRMVRELATAASSIGGEDEAAGLSGEGGVGSDGRSDAAGSPVGDVAEVA